MESPSVISSQTRSADQEMGNELFVATSPSLAIESEWEWKHSLPAIDS